MRWRTTIILAFLAVGLGLWYYLYEVGGREAREAAQRAERRVLDFDLDRVREIAVEKPGERVVVRNDGERWRMIEPEQVDADGPTVEGLLAFVRRLEKVRSLEGSGDLREFGLDAPTVRLRLGFRGGETMTLLLGDPNPAGTGVYAQLQGAPVVFLAPSELERELAKSPYLDELRDKTILAVDPDRIRRFEIFRADTRIAVEHVSPHQWRIERPFEGPGDDGIIRDLLWKIGASRASTVIAAPRSLAAYGLDRPHARVVVVDEQGTAHALLMVRSTGDPRDLYVHREGGHAVYVTNSQLLVDLALAPDTFRNRQLLVFDPRQVERIAIRYPQTTLVLERAGDRWRVIKPVEGEAVFTTVENILEVLPNLRYTAVEPSPGELRPYGLDNPELVVTVGLEGGLELPTVAVGRQEGGQRFVMIGGGGPVYTVDARLFRVIPEDPTDAKRYSLPERLKRGREKIQQGKS